MSESSRGLLGVVWGCGLAGGGRMDILQKMEGMSGLVWEAFSEFIYFAYTHIASVILLLFWTWTPAVQEGQYDKRVTTEPFEGKNQSKV